MKVAYFSPLPPERTGISEYSELLLPALRRRIEVEVVPRGRTSPADADVCLYHVGNNPDAHGWIVEALRRRPGVVVLHDFVLHHLVAGLTLGRRDGPDRERLEQLARERGLDGRATFAGRVTDEELADLYARCLGVYYAPVNEDYGLVPYEAFLSEKPVVTTTDAGGPLEVVSDRATGLVCEPRAQPLADACAWLLGHADEARDWGRAGKELAQAVSWDRAIERLLAPE